MDKRALKIRLLRALCNFLYKMQKTLQKRVLSSIIAFKALFIKHLCEKSAFELLCLNDDLKNRVFKLFQNDFA